MTAWKAAGLVVIGIRLPASASRVHAMSLLDSNDVFVVSETPTPNSLETINLTTGAVTDIGHLNDTVTIAAGSIAKFRLRLRRL